MIKAMMAEKFKNILLPAAEDVMPASTYRRYDDDDDIVKRKLKNMKRMEE